MLRSTGRLALLASLAIGGCGGGPDAGDLQFVDAVDAMLTAISAPDYSVLGERLRPQSVWGMRRAYIDSAARGLFPNPPSLYSDSNSTDDPLDDLSQVSARARDAPHRRRPLLELLPQVTSFVSDTKGKLLI